VSAQKAAWTSPSDRRHRPEEKRRQSTVTRDGKDVVRDGTSSEAFMMMNFNSRSEKMVRVTS